MVELSLLDHLLLLIGEVTLLLLIALVLQILLLLVLSLASFHSGRLYFPRLLKPGFTALEGVMRAIFKFIGLDDQEMLTFSVRLLNTMNLKAFAAIPVSERAIFLPQCLRAARCPAHLTPEGLKCVSCGQCGIGEVRPVLENLGYRVFLVPGSSFIKRMVKKYRPRALIGVGCLLEVKEGLEMADKMHLIGLGVVTLKDGCVETLVDWSALLEVATLGLDPSTIPVDLHVPAT
jgi:hypothetical protein